EAKWIRVFLQDGSNDLNIYGGDWWMANQAMERSLVFAGYEVQHVWGEGQHSGAHGTAIFPDAMRWLWKGWPEPVKAGVSKNNNTLDALLIPGEGWKLAGEGYRFTQGPAVNAEGEGFFTDGPNNKIHKIGLRGKGSGFVPHLKRAKREALRPDGGPFLGGEGGQKIVAYDIEKPGSSPAVIAEGVRGNDIVVARNGNIYVTEPNVPAADQSNVWLIKPNGEKKVVDTGLRYANGVTLSPDQTLLYVA